MSKLTHEVCIIGAGPVGLALANCLALSPHIRSVALVDRKLPQVLPQMYSIPNQRVFSINSPSLRFLESINALQRVRQCGNLKSIEVMSKQSESFIEWEENSAKIIENDELVSALLHNLGQLEGSGKIEMIEDEVASINNQNYAQCEVALTKRNISTKLLVGSDGNKSKVKELSRIPTYGWSYRQKAIACTLSMEGLDSASNNAAFQIYHDSNILGILPLWNNYISIVWSLQLADFEHTIQLSDQQFIASLNALISTTNATHSGKTDYRPIGKINGIVNKRLAFPLNSLQAENYTKHRLALIGDAAHSIHPMAGLGVNSGIMDSVMLANNIILNKRTGNDIGEALSLSTYEASSKAMNYGNSVAMESIKKLFEVDSAPFNFIRKGLLGFAQDTQPFKALMRSVVEQNPLASVGRYEWEHL